ncbi:ester cyclase [Burkholderia multivorans]|uniref:ester cyclase n=1 Tax=Burkholderia multivorans TaxID=87883 RepID=UPI0021C1A765|nr:ester cyclase [Burkholderia multivorans]
MQMSTPRRAWLRVATSLVFASILIVPPALARDTTEPGSVPTDATAANVAVVKRFLTDVVNGGRFDLVDQLWAKDMVWHGASLGEVRGIDAYRKGLEASVGGSFSKMRLDIKDVIASGDKVVVHFTNSGENTGPFLGFPATGKYSIWEGIGIYKVIGGKIAEAWFVEDILGQQQMLGHWPPQIMP